MTDLSGHEHRSGVGFTDRIGDPSIRDAVRIGLGFVAAGLLFLVTASLWMSTCTGSTVDALACGAPQRAGAAVGAPVIFFVGAAVSLLRGARVHREAPSWWAWQGAGATLIALTVLTAIPALP
ncbi:hypothetical protein FK535_25580 [Mycolicibacterium sp. 018/SC-01/001]|uniref:hypothetical protein n=1 Tax=Mycolicibacterium sp. 018/SC-01/001 TaxID=2592069 RepID=UPI00117DECBD|nr:hypothetical protein [Mycolicibacterium sp. 018/SC-01/001]TRW78335.1 hypothetical protein FK535_25580 [Mycolicibacterium sp. 018/SC-01/001]